jgi:hypothetical protein
VKDTSEEVAGSTFGDSLEAVQNHRQVLDDDDSKLTSEAKTKKDALDVVWNELMSMGAKDNRYTAFTIDDMEKSKNSLGGALEKRREAYAAELARQEAMEAKRKEFADAAAKFVKYLEEDKATIDGLRGEPDSLGEQIKGHHQNGAVGKQKLEDLEALDADCKSMGITENKHTPYTFAVLQSKNRQHDHYVAKYLGDLEEEKALKQDYDNRIQALLKWIRETIPKQGEREFDNTLDGARAKVSQFTTYKNTEKAEKFADKREIEGLDASIKQYLTSSAHTRPAFSPQVGLADLKREWDGLDSADKQREDALQTELRRQEKLRDLVAEFGLKESRLNKWADQKEAYLTTSENIDTLSAAHVQDSS